MTLMNIDPCENHIGDLRRSLEWSI